MEILFTAIAVELQIVLGTLLSRMVHKKLICALLLEYCIWLPYQKAYHDEIFA